MKFTYASFALLVCALTALANPAGSAPSPKEVVARLDQAAAHFHNMKAQITRKKHTAVLNEDSTEKGTVYMGKTSSGAVLGRMDISSPDAKQYSFDGRKVQIYLPKEKTVQVYDNLGKNGEQLEQFMTLGFGTSGRDLEKTYNMRVVGMETLGDQNTVHLQLEPKSSDAKKYVEQVDLWITENGSYPVQEKILQSSGDYDLWSYANVQINPNPPLKDDDLKLVPPKGVNYVYPGH